MKTFTEYYDMSRTIEENNAERAIIETLIIMESETDEIFSLNESSQLLKKLGLHVSRGKGLIDYIQDIGKGVGKLFFAAIKGDKQAVKEIAQSVKKRDVVDFILKLDQATLHVVMGPIHLIDAITGWNIKSNIDVMSRGVVDAFLNAIEHIKDNAKKFVGDETRTKKILSHVKQIEKNVLAQTA